MILFGSVIVVYVLNDPTAVWLVLMYFDPYNGSSYMIQVVFCLYVYRIYLAIRRGLHLSRMTTNNLISCM